VTFGLATKKGETMAEVCDIKTQHCIPCKGGILPMKGEALAGYLAQLPDAWRIVDEHHLVCRYEFSDFRQALDFTNAVGALAEHESHHPEITLTWGRVTVRIWTHKIDGLTVSDFVLASKISTIQ
jgi:4a-hydroxytetrahydrobiopterin dehydratase